ncbi:MAG: hypothetical protein A2049_09940 [Elusimicrobia bacterium GWA2_62_23]|nr:MAG: hypothetical protein A2049_09940 [Elusimicrobia bacterium GWA2_62_23]OGR67222.1 MAG: hypothetical protein A2179_01760 [Elusimicrobia bacterium GWC2_63_65]
MKLNLGCGYNRLEGWLNLDASPASAADRTMPAHDLDLPAASVSEIRAVQLAEHLGFFKAKYFLSECWRVLEPGGKLLLETPHIEKTFEFFLAGGHAVKEAALGWVYGSETPGMGHVYCFPAPLLEELLSEAGFEVERREEFLFQPARPALRFLVVKKQGEKAALNAALRRKLLDDGVAIFGEEETSAGLELAVRRLVAGGGNSASELEQALVSAPAALAYFSLAEENEHRPSREAAACARLCGWELQGRQAAAYLAGLESGLSDRQAFEKGLEAGRELLAAALAGQAQPPGQGPQPGAPAVFTPGAAAGWAFRRKFKAPR